MLVLRHREGPQAVAGEQARGTAGRGWLGAEHVVDRESYRRGRVVARVVGAEKSAGEPVRADLVSQLPAKIVVGTHAGEIGQHGIALADFKRLVACQRPQLGLVFLEGLHAEAAHNVVVQARVVMAGKRERHIAQEVALRAEVAAHAVRERVFVFRVVHGEEIDADVQVAVFGQSLHAPVGSAVAVDALILDDVVAGEILAANVEVESRLRVAVRELQVALVGNDAAPDLALGGEAYCRRGRAGRHKKAGCPFANRARR